MDRRSTTSRARARGPAAGWLDGIGRDVRYACRTLLRSPLSAATIVVIVMALISAVILGVFDIVWSNLTELIYG